MSESAPLLHVDSVSAGYGRVPMLRQVSLHVREGEIVALLGANGAGKSTLLKTVVGLLRPSAGSVRLNDRELTTLSTEVISRAGVALVPEGRQLFGAMTVLENLQLGAHATRDRRRVAHAIERVFVLFPALQVCQRQRADSLSGGQQQMLAIGRCLMSGPRLVLLDEPSLGLAPKMVARVFETVSQLRATGVTFLIVEQNVLATLRLADRAYVFERGRVVLEGFATDVASSPLVQAAYLGRPKGPAASHSGV